MANRRRLKSSQTHPAPLAPAEVRAVSQTVSTSPVTAVSAPSPIATDETLRECFIQASENARAYMDLRFKHFGTQYLADELHRIRVFKELLSVPSTNVPKHTVVLRSSYATNLMFLVVVVMWSIILLLFLPSYDQNA